MNTSMLASILFDYSDVYILVSGTRKFTGAGVYDAAKRLEGRKN